MALKARDVMQTGVITVDPESPLLDVYRLFVSDEIHGAPVVDDGAQVLGVVTSSDLLRSVDEERDTAAAESTYYRDTLPIDRSDWPDPADFQERLAERTVSEVMTKGAISVDVDAGIGDIARTIQRSRIHRVLVCERGELVGMITTFDLVGVLADGEGAEA
jgi:predicted transcriptional regulator